MKYSSALGLSRGASRRTHEDRWSRPAACIVVIDSSDGSGSGGEATRDKIDCGKGPSGPLSIRKVRHNRSALSSWSTPATIGE